MVVKEKVLPKLKPLRDILVVRLLEPPKRESGIIVPEMWKEYRERAKVLAVGPGKRYNGNIVPIDVKVGDIILFMQAHGWDLPAQFDAKDIKLLEEGDVLAVIEDGSSSE